MKKIYKITRRPTQFLAILNCYTWIPKNWDYVSIEVLEQKADEITVKFRKVEV